MYVLRTNRPDSGFQNAPNGHKLEKQQWRKKFSIWRHLCFFWRCLISLLDFSYWSKFHVNIITGSTVMTIFLYKGLTRNRNPEIPTSEYWSILSRAWRELAIANLVWMSLMKWYWILQNVRVTALTVSELSRENQQGAYTYLPTQIKSLTYALVLTI